MKFNSKKLLTILSVGVCLSAGVGSVISESNPQTSTAASVKTRVLPKKYRGKWYNPHSAEESIVLRKHEGISYSHVKKNSCTVRYAGMSGDHYSIKYAIKYVKYNHKNYKILVTHYPVQKGGAPAPTYYIKKGAPKKIAKKIFKKYRLNSSHPKL